MIIMTIIIITTIIINNIIIIAMRIIITMFNLRDKATLCYLFLFDRISTFEKLLKTITHETSPFN